MSVRIVRDLVAVGRVGSALKVEEALQQPLKSTPEPERVDDGIDPWRESAVAAVVRAAVVLRVLGGGLDDSGLLKKDDDAAVLGA